MRRVSYQSGLYLPIDVLRNVTIDTRLSVPQPGISELETEPDVKQSWLRWSVLLLVFTLPDHSTGTDGPLGSHAVLLDRETERGGWLYV